MMTRKGLALTASALALGLVGGPLAAQDVAREDTLILDLDRTIADPENFNWFTRGTKREHGAHQTMWEPLFVLDAQGNPEPWLATGITSNDTFDQWTMTLREGVTWSDGEAFSADDVVFTVNMVLGNENLVEREASQMRGMVDSVERVDDLTVVFNLKSPNPRFVSDILAVRVFAAFLSMPEHIWSQVDDPATFTFYPPIGTGPYTLTSVATNRAIWDRNDDWWGAATGFMDLPEPLRVVVLETGGEEARAQLLATNQLDAGQNVTLGTFEAIQAQNPAVKAWRGDLPYAWPDPCARQLEFNTTVAPWDDADMRRAIAHIIDRTQIVNVAYEGTTVPSRSMFVQYEAMEPFIAAIEEAGLGLPETADVDAGKALIEAAGYTMGSDGYYERNGERLTANIHVNSASTEYTRTIDVIVEQLQRAGIDARSIPVENGVFWGEVLPLGGYDITYSWLSCGSVNEPWASMSRYTNASIAPIGERAPGFNNTGRWNTDATAAYTEIVDRMGSMALGADEIPGMVADAYRYLADEMPFIPLVQSAKLLPFNTTYWEGWPSVDNDYTPPAFWRGDTHRIIHELTRAD